MVNLCNGGTKDFVELSTSNHFCLPNEKKPVCLKQPLKNFIQWEMRNRHKEQCIKNKCLSDYIYSLATL